MRMTGWLTLAAGAAICCGCAATVPSELVNARLAYQHASAGPAADLAPADLHRAQDALAVAERSFSKDANSYRTRDLSYVAQRKAEMAAAQALIVMEQADQARATNDYQVTQGDILEKRTSDLNQTRSALAVSQQSGQATAERLSAEQGA
jgi:hypothetical protein